MKIFGWEITIENNYKRYVLIVENIEYREEKKLRNIRLNKKLDELEKIGALCKNCGQLEDCGLATEEGVDINDDWCTEWVK